MSQTPLGYNTVYPQAYVPPVTGGKLGGNTGDAQGSLIVSQYHGTKYRAAYLGNLFSAANQASVTTSAALATTYVGLCISNPAASGKVLAVRNVTGVLGVAVAAGTFFQLIYGYAAGGITVHTTPVTPTPGYLNSANTPVGLVDAACTLVGTPTWGTPLYGAGTTTSLGSFVVDLGGAIIIPPGGYLAIGTNIAGPAAGFRGGFEWGEYPL